MKYLENVDFDLQFFNQTKKGPESGKSSVRHSGLDSPVSEMHFVPYEWTGGMTECVWQSEGLLCSTVHWDKVPEGTFHQWLPTCSCNLC